MSEEDGIRNTLARYCQLLDDRRFDEFEDVFAQDASWTALGETHRGRGTIRKFIEEFPREGGMGKHLTLNSVIEVDGDGAHATSDFIVIREGPGGGMISVAGRYRDRLVKQGDRWRFAERVATAWGRE